MTEKKKDPARVLLKNVRLSYPALWKPKAFGGDGDSAGEPRFQANGLIDPESKLGRINISRIEDAIAFVTKEKWPKGAPKLGPAKIAFKDSEDMEDLKDGYKGMVYVSAASAKRPRVLDGDGQDTREGDEDSPYAGCFVNMIVRFWVQDNKYGKRINASLEGVKFMKDGDAFGAAPVDDDDFDDGDDEDEKPRFRSRGRDDDEDEKPRSRSRGRDEDEDEKPRSRSRGREDDEDEKPRTRRTRDEDDDDKPRSGRRRNDDMA